MFNQYDPDAYSDLPQGHPVPPQEIAGTGNGDFLGDNLATVGGGVNAGQPGLCWKCLLLWAGVIGGLLFLYRNKDKFTR